MTTRLRLATVAIGTVLLTTSALADDTTPFAGIVLVSPAGYTATPTLVQQLTAKLAYQQEALAEHPNNTYLGPASKRTAKHLAAAIAAEAAGSPLPPMLSENGGVVPLSKFGGNHVGAPAPTTPTLVQQLTAKLAYQQEELAEHPNNTYLGPASKRTAKHVAAAIAAEAAGSPLPPMLSENGGVVPLSKFGGNYVDAPATPVPYAAGLLRVAKSLAAATSEGTLSLTPDTGLPSANSDTGIPSSNPDGGVTSQRGSIAMAVGGDGGIPSSNTDTGIASNNPDTGIKSSNPDGGAGVARGG